MRIFFSCRISSILIICHKSTKNIGLFIINFDFFVSQPNKHNHRIASKNKAPKVIDSRGFITFIIIMIYYSFKSFSSQANALAPSTAASESFNSETSNFVLPL